MRRQQEEETEETTTTPIVSSKSTSKKKTTTAPPKTDIELDALQYRLSLLFPNEKYPDMQTKVRATS